MPPKHLVERGESRCGLTQTSEGQAPQFWCREHQMPFSGVTLKHLKGRQKSGEDTVALAGKMGVDPPPPTLLLLLYLLASLKTGRDEKQTSRRSRKRGSFCQHGLALARIGGRQEEACGWQSCTFKGCSEKRVLDYYHSGYY